MKKSLLSLSFILMALFAAGSLKASVIYTPMNITANQSSPWNWFAFDVDADGFGLWVNPGAALRLETYQGKVVGTDEGGLIYLTSLPYGTEIGAGSAWVTPATPTYINDATHTTLNGNTVYIAVQLTAADNTLFYGWMQLVVAADGLSVTLTGMAYQDEPGASLLAGVIDRQVYYATTGFLEDLGSNDGTVGTTVAINLEGVDFSIATGAFTQGTHYTVANLPAGLTTEIRATDSKHAVIVLNGKATAHAMSDAVSNLTLSFLDAAFNGVPAADIIASSREDLAIKFFDPYQIVYDNLEDLVCGVNGWAPFSNDYFENTFGLWHDGTDMRIETYGKSIVGTSLLGKSYFTPIDEGALIDASSTWVTTGNWPDEPYLTTAAYTTWNGKHKYAGIQLTVGDATLYGWLNLEVSSDGKTVTLLDWAFNTQPNGAIRAGQMVSGIPTTGLEKIEMRLFPNPVQSSLMISLTNPLKVAADLQIIDVAGKVVYQDKLFPDGSMKYLVGTGNLGRGVYFVRVNSSEVSFTQKLIRE
jgi:hypothetical protein